MYKTETEKHNLIVPSDSWIVNRGLIYIRQVIP